MNIEPVVYTLGALSFIAVWIVGVLALVFLAKKGWREVLRGDLERIVR